MLDTTFHIVAPCSERLLELEARERELGIKSDPDLHAYMTALNASGKQVRGSRGVITGGCVRCTSETSC